MNDASESSHRRRRSHGGQGVITALVGGAVFLAGLAYGVWQQLEHETVQTAPPPPAPDWPVVVIVAGAGLVVLIGAIRVIRRG